MVRIRLSPQVVECHRANVDYGTADGQDSSERFVPGFAAVTRLLGKLHRASGDAKSAVNYQVQALETNPFMWDSFTDLCDTGGLGVKLSA